MTTPRIYWEPTGLTTSIGCFTVEFPREFTEVIPEWKLRLVRKVVFEEKAVESWDRPPQACFSDLSNILRKNGHILTSLIEVKVENQIVRLIGPAARFGGGPVQPDGFCLPINAEDIRRGAWEWPVADAVPSSRGGRWNIQPSRRGTTGIRILT